MPQVKVLKLFNDVSATVNHYLEKGWKLRQPIQFLSVRQEDGYDMITCFVVLINEN